MPYKYYKQAAKFEPSTGVAANAFLDELFNCQFPGSGRHSVGFYSLKPGASLPTVCETHEIKLLVEGSHKVTDEETGQTTVGTAGDVFFFEKGSKITYTPVGNYAKGFYFTQLPEAIKSVL